ncbi:hypothetical protein SKAU_G00383290 [Synaphobranchus kaupii]|uniref:CIDE-N domain-containing protein n=1 Tax=Synaphobranchus kaupii TaxID=118154 RepID=A0A9Q1IEW3_SYNKA|nr:hypothetical protein SKAU_G00383290 [Synaphobranchus kaupii]
MGPQWTQRSSFQSLPANTGLIVLERGQRWTKALDDRDGKKPWKNGMAKLSFHLYKLHPKDFPGLFDDQS